MSTDEKKWYVWYSYSTYTDRAGPFTWQEIEQMVMQGKLREEDKIWVDSLAQWKKVNEIQELIPLLSQHGKSQDASAKKKVLIVDDDNTLREFLQSIFEEKGYQVYTASEGTEGLRLAHFELPDLILLDVTMPRLSGWEVCKRLKKEERTRNIPVIFLTARDQVPDKLLGMELGSAKYLTKPFDLNLLEKTVDELLGTPSVPNA
ncbi:MAG: response regulator [Elusimicrobiota bacterium]